MKPKICRLASSITLASMTAILLLGVQGIFFELPRMAASAEIANIYRTLAELSDRSELIVVGQFQGSPIYYPEVHGPDYPPRADSEALVPTDRDPALIAMNRMSYITTNFQVREVLKSGNRLDLSTVNVAQIAYLNQGQLLSVSEERLFRADEEYVLFLDSADDVDGDYWVTGAVQGAFKIQDGSVSSLDKLGEKRVIVGLGIDKQPLADFLNDVRSSLKTEIDNQ